MTERPIRLMRLIARLNIGGPAIHVTLLTQRLTQPAYETLLVCGQIEPQEGDMTYFAQEHGINPLVIPELGRSLSPIKDLKTLWTLIKLMREFKPDVVHTHSAKAGFVGRMAAWLTGVPVIVHTFHGHTFHSYFGFWRTHLFIWLERLTAGLSDTIITLTESLRRELAETYRITRKSHITVLPLGFDLSAFSEMPRQQGRFRAVWGIASDAPLIGIVGRMVPVKNHDLFLRTAALIRQHLPQARFVIVGDGELRSELEAQTRELGLQDSVIFTGWQRDTALIYSDLDALVISSLNEGTPVTLIEGLAAGCPVVATAVGGVADLLDGGQLGQLVPSNDAPALAEAIISVIANPPDGRPAQQLMLDRYGIDRLVKDLDSLYRGLLAQNRQSKQA